MGLSAGGLSGEGGLYAGQKGQWTTDTIKQNVYFLIKVNLYLKSYLSGSKIGINAFYGRAYARGELINEVKKCLGKGGLIYRGPVRDGGGGGLIGGEIWYSMSRWQPVICFSKLSCYKIIIS